jgi:hypothetical protein
MSPEHNQQPGAFTASAVEMAHVSAPLVMERGDDGIWRYEGIDVGVPGAVDVPLAARVQAYQVLTPSGEPDGALIPAADVEADLALEFVKRVGRRLSGDDPADDVYRVSQPFWEEHGGQAVGVEAPELGDDGRRRRLAIEERELRFARRRQEQQAVRRACAVALVAALGMTRKEAAGILGLTAGRVQQLIDELSVVARREVDELVEAIGLVLRRMGDQPVRAADVSCPAATGQSCSTR